MPKDNYILAIFKLSDVFIEFSNLLKDEGFTVKLQSKIKKEDILNFSGDIIIIDFDDFDKLDFLFNNTQKFSGNLSILLFTQKRKIEFDSKNIIIFRKPFIFNELIKKINRRIFQKSSDIKIKLDNIIFFPKKSYILNLSNNKKINLTELENKFLKYLLKNRKGCIKTEILENVWGHNRELDTHTLESLIYRLRRKIEKNPNQPKILIQLQKKYFLDF